MFSHHSRLDKRVFRVSMSLENVFDAQFLVTERNSILFAHSEWRKGSGMPSNVMTLRSICVLLFVACVWERRSFDAKPTFMDISVPAFTKIPFRSCGHEKRINLDDAFTCHMIATYVT